MKRLILVLIAVILSSSIFTAFAEPEPNFAKFKYEGVGTDPGATPEQIQARMEALNSFIDLRYDATVQKYIDNYMKKGRKSFGELLVRAAYYMPIFERALKEADLPDELKYVPLIESALHAKVKSYAGAGGLWQFMPATAKGYDLKVNSHIDERSDPYSSSVGACKLFKKLYDKFGDWTLVLAAYNAGPGTVQKALKRAGGDPKEHNFWTIYNYLPGQTKAYVPKFIAMIYMMNYYPEHNISKVPAGLALVTDTVHVRERVHFSQIASVLDVTVQDLRDLNPHFRSDVIVASVGQPCNLILPKDQIDLYRENFSSIKEVTPTSTPSEVAETNSTAGKSSARSSKATKSSSKSKSKLTASTSTKSGKKSSTANSNTRRKRRR